MSLSVIILTKNEEKMIKNCLSSIGDLADEIIIIDDNSRDNTKAIAKNYNAKIFVHPKINFADQRNFGLSQTRGDWVLYLDADERLSPGLKQQILEIISKSSSGQPVITNYYLVRQNYYLGDRWPQKEKIKRLFQRNKLKGWQGELHESPITEGDTGLINNCFYHYTHRDLSSMLTKTLDWSGIEADLRYQAHHSPVVWWRFLRVMTTQFWNYFIIQKGYKNGTVGMIESFYQTYSIFITYARLYEIQNAYLGHMKEARNENSSL